jgi:hypothetical protein
MDHKKKELVRNKQAANRVAKWRTENLAIAWNICYMFCDIIEVCCK